MKLATLAFLTLLTCTSCDTLHSDGNATKFYLPFAGTQQNWPTAPAGFTTSCDGMTIYHGLPPRPYILLGKFDRADISPARLVKCARYYHADAIFLDEHTFNEQRVDRGITFGNERFSATTPTTSRVVQRTEGIPYLIRFTTNPPTP